MALKCTGRGKKSPLNRGVDLTDTDPPKKSSIFCVICVSTISSYAPLY